MQIYVIGAGERINRADLTMLGKTGTVLSNDPRGFQEGLRGNQPEAGQPRRREVRVLVLLDQAEGQPQAGDGIDTPVGDAKVKHKFDAAGFTNACTPKQKSMFEEIEAMKAEVAVKQKELDAKAQEKEAAEAEAAAAAIKMPEPGGKGARATPPSDQDRQQGVAEGHGEGGGQGAREGRAGPGPGHQGAGAGGPPTPGKRGPPKAAAGPSKQAVDNE